LERRNGFEPSHPRVEALAHSLFYVTSANYTYKRFSMPIYSIDQWSLVFYQLLLSCSASRHWICFL